MELSSFITSLEVDDELETLITLSEDIEPYTICNLSCKYGKEDLLNYVLKKYTQEDLDLKHNYFEDFIKNLKQMSEFMIITYMLSLSEKDSKTLIVERGYQIFESVCAMKYFDMASTLHSQVDKFATEFYWFQLLYKLIEGRHLESFKWLIMRHDSLLDNPTYFEGFYFCSCDVGNIDSLNYLMCKNPEFTKTSTFYKGFARACKLGRKTLLDRLIELDEPSIVSNCESNGVLADACIGGYNNVVLFLLGFYKKNNIICSGINDGFITAFLRNHFEILCFLFPFITYNDCLLKSIEEMFAPACEKGNYETIRTIVTNDWFLEKMKLNKKNMLSACKSGNKKLVKLLIDVFPTFDVQSNMHEYLESDVDTDMFYFLLELCDNKSEILKNVNFTQVFIYCNEKTVATVRTILEVESCANYMKANICSFFLIACEKKLKELVQIVLSFSTPSDYTRIAFTERFSLVCCSNNMDVMQLLLDFDREESLIDYELCGPKLVGNACKYNNIKAVAFLIDKVSGLNTIIDSLFCEACSKGYFEMAMMFIQKFNGIKLSYKNWSGFKIACESKYYDIIGLYENACPNLEHKYDHGTIVPIIKPLTVACFDFEKDEICSICSSSHSDVMVDCKHKFCSKCLQGFPQQTTESSCPLCGVEINETYVDSKIPL
jgi:hypothetical protein